jgi:hypothetical protein
MGIGWEGLVYELVCVCVYVCGCGCSFVPFVRSFIRLSVCLSVCPVCLFLFVCRSQLKGHLSSRTWKGILL